MPTGHGERTTLSHHSPVMVCDMKTRWKKTAKKTWVILNLLMRGSDEMESSPDYGNNHVIWRNTVASFHIWFEDMDPRLVCSGELSCFG